MPSDRPRQPPGAEDPSCCLSCESQAQAASGMRITNQELRITEYAFTLSVPALHPFLYSSFIILHSLYGTHLWCSSTRQQADSDCLNVHQGHWPSACVSHSPRSRHRCRGEGGPVVRRTRSAPPRTH